MQTFKMYIPAEDLEGFLKIAPDADATVLKQTPMPYDMYELEVMCDNIAAIFIIGREVGYNQAYKDADKTVTEILDNIKGRVDGLADKINKIK